MFFNSNSFVVGESCESEHKPCPGLKYSLCRRGFCQCQDGFYEKDGICKAELGELVEEEKYCGSGSFANNRCICQTNQFYNPNMRTCNKGKQLKLKISSNSFNLLIKKLRLESTLLAHNPLNALPTELLIAPFWIHVSVDATTTHYTTKKLSFAN